MRRTSSLISPRPRATTCASLRPSFVRKTARLRRSKSGVPRSPSRSRTARQTAPCVRFRQSAALLKLSSLAATRKQASAGSDVMCCLICHLFSHILSEVIVFAIASAALLRRKSKGYRYGRMARRHHHHRLHRDQSGAGLRHSVAQCAGAFSACGYLNRARHRTGRAGPCKLYASASVC